MIKRFLFKRPTWFTHEGYWRLAQVVRLGPFVCLMLYAVVALIASLIYRGSSAALFSLNAFGGGLALLVATHLLLRLIVWIVEGFHAAKKSA